MMDLFTFVGLLFVWMALNKIDGQFSTMNETLREIATQLQTQNVSKKNEDPSPDA